MKLALLQLWEHRKDLRCTMTSISTDHARKGSPRSIFYPLPGDYSKYGSCGIVSPVFLRSKIREICAKTYLSFCFALKYDLNFDLVDRLFAYRIQSVEGFPSPVNIETTSPFCSSYEKGTWKYSTNERSPIRCIKLLRCIKY